jgi:hypothetical protein
MATPIFQPAPCLMVVRPDDGLADEAARGQKVGRDTTGHE